MKQTASDTQLFKLSRFNQLFFEHEFVQSVRNRIAQFHKVSWCAKSSDFLVLYGDSGCGKSTILKKYRDNWNKTYIHDSEEVGVLYISVPSKCSPRALAEAILTKLGDPLAHKGTQYSLTIRAAHYINQKQVSLLILDEFNHFIDKENMKVAYDAGRLVKVVI